MANQAIALQARAPQGNFLAPAIQQGAQFINMMSQQRAADRQAAMQQQQMQLQLAGEERAKAGEARAADKAVLDRELALYDKHRRLAPLVRDANTYTKFLGGVAKDSPETATLLMDALPPDQFNPDTFVLLMGKMDDVFKAQYGSAITRDVTTPEGVVMGANISSIPGKSFAAPIPDISQPRAPMAAPAAPPTAPAAPAPATGGMFRPAAFSPDQGGGMDANAGLQAIQTAMQTKMIDPATLDQVRQMAGPQAAAVDAWMQKNGIQVSPGGGMQSAVYRPDGGAPMAQQVQYDPNAYAPLRAKSPMQSPLPGSASVPLPRVAAEARAGRETPEEVYAKELAKLRAARDAGPKPLTPVQEAKLRDNIAKDSKSAQATVNMMLDPESGVIAAVNAVRNLTPDQKESVTGYSGYLPSVTASSKTADTKIKNLKGKVTEMGKAAATLTGAIGQMAVQEWRIVSDMIANLDIEGMNAEDLDDQLDIIESTARRAAATTQDAYTNQYAEEFERYPNRFRLKEPSAGKATPVGKKPSLDSFFKGG